MSDFDFDELDKAVSGALGSAPESSTSPQPAPVTPEAPTVTPEARTAAPATRRSGGRFMDMVHPTSDMRSARPEGALKVVESEATSNPSISSAPEEVAFPPSDDVVSQPLESPFLPDAKVEKRPLGGVGIFPPSEPSFEDIPPSGEEKPTTSDQHIMPDPIEFAQRSQPEFEEPSIQVEPPVFEQVQEAEPVVDTLAEAPLVESTSELNSADTLETQLANIEAEAPEAVETPEETATPQVQPEVSADTTSTGPTSINQQYKEQPSSTPQTGSIFDTEAYHQPLVHHAAKKKSGLWVIIWILVLVIAGAGAGVAFYLYILPTL